MNAAQRDKLMDAISKASVERFRSGLAMENASYSVDEIMEIYVDAQKCTELAYRMVWDIWAGDQAKNGL